MADVVMTGNNDENKWMIWCFKRVALIFLRQTKHEEEKNISHLDISDG